MTLKCYVVDDEEHASQIIATYIEMTEGLELIGTEIDPVNAFKKISENELKPDIAFLDIDMPKISGLELAGLIEGHTEVIFTTAFPEYAAKSYEANAVDYMIKPVSYVRFLKAIGKVRKNLSLINGSYKGEEELPKADQKETAKDEPNDTYFFIKTSPDGKLIKVSVNEIIYAEAKHNYVELYFKDKSHIAYLTLSEAENKLPADSFVRVQKSYIVNVEMVKSIEGNCVTMTNGSQVVVGRSYRKMFQGFIEEKSLKKKRNFP